MANWWHSVDALKTALNVFGGLGAGATVLAVVIAVRLQFVERRRAGEDEARWTTTQRELSSARAESEALRARQLEAAERLEETRRRAAEAERQLRQLEEKARPRELTADQRARLLAALKSVPKPASGIKLSAPNGDAEAAQFAEQIAKVLEAAGWGGEYNSSTIFAGPPLSGVHVFVQDGQLPAAKAIVSVLKELGHDATFHAAPSYPPNHFAITVRAKK